MNNISYTPITQNPVPDLFKIQLERFTFESIHAEQIANFNPNDTAEALRAKDGKQVIGADFGGDKGLTQLYTIRNGQLVLDDTYKDYVQGALGDGYLASLDKTAAYANQHNIPIGISWGAPLNGTKPLYHPKVDHFLKELDERYNNDFKNVVPTLKACLNDGPAGLISGIVEAGKDKQIDAVLFAINGGGLGMAALVKKAFIQQKQDILRLFPS